MNTQNHIIRPAQFEDLPHVAHIHVKSWQQTYAGQVSQRYLDGLDVAARQKRWEESFHDKAKKGHSIYLAWQDNAPIGFVSFGPARDEDMKDHGEIYAIYLLREAWGQAFGHALFQAARQKLWEQGFSAAYLWVLDTNANAIRAYKRWGGTVDAGSIKDLMIGDGSVREIKVKFSVS